MGAATIDTRMVREALAVFLAPDQVSEVRAFGPKRDAPAIYAKLFSDHARMAEEAVKITGAAGVYFVPNPIKPDWKGSAKAEGILSRRWLLCDVDPYRIGPDGKVLTGEAGQVMSTEVERQAAWGVLESCRALCDGAGLAGEVIGDSGSGWHLCHPIDLPNDQASYQLVADFLAGLEARCGTEAAHIDQKPKDAPRVWKLYGTWARRGPDTPERPHSLARLISGRPWAEETARLNNAALERLLVIWRAQAARDNARREAERPDAYRRCLEYLSKCEPSVSGQRGHDKLMWAARAAVWGFDLGQAAGAAAVREAFNPRCLPPWSDKEIEHKCKEADSKPYSQPRGWLLREDRTGRNGSHHANGKQAEPKAAPEAPSPWEPIVPLWEVPQAPPFPLGVLPAPLREFADLGGHALSCPADFVAVPMLAVASAAVGNTRRLAITASHYQPALLFTCCVGAPGSGKSPALELAAAPLEEAQRRFLAEWGRARREHQADPEGVPAPLPPRRVLVDDITTEALVGVLATNPRGLGMIRDELAALVTGMNQYKGDGKGSDRQTFLKLWSQATIRNDRKHYQEGAPVTVYRPFMAVAGGTQPDVISAMRGDVKPGATPPPNDGLLDRFLVSFPAATPAVEETWREVPAEVAANWREAVLALLDLEMVRDQDEFRPFVVHLTPCGKLAWQSFTREHAAEVNDPDFPEFLAGPWSKLRGYCGRLALVIHCLREVAGEDVRCGLDRTSLEAGAELVAYFKGHTRKVLAAMDADPVAARARRVLRWVAREQRKEFKRRELFIDVKSQLYFPTMDSLGPALNRLARHNYVRVKPAPKATAGRPEAETWEVHPDAINRINGINKRVAFVDSVDSVDP